MQGREGRGRLWRRLRERGCRRQGGVGGRREEKVKVKMEEKSQI
jgi:hypothetical protein